MENNLLGKKVSALVTKVENYGLFLELDNKEKAFLPKENMKISKKKKLKEIFSEGFVLSAVVKGYKKDYYVVTQKEDVEKNVEQKNKKVVKKSNREEVKNGDKTTKKKSQELNKSNKKSKVEKKKTSKEQTSIVLNEEQIEEPKVKTITDLKKLKYIGNMKISVKKAKENKKTLEIEEEVQPELLDVPKNFIKDVLTTTEEMMRKFEKVKKSLKEQGYLNEY